MSLPTNTSTPQLTEDLSGPQSTMLPTKDPPQVTAQLQQRSDPQHKPAVTIVTSSQRSVTSTSSASSTQEQSASISTNPTGDPHLDITVTQMKHPNMADWTRRRDSFRRKNWPSQLDQTPEEMATAGFFSVGKITFIVLNHGFDLRKHWKLLC